ncbi:DUF4123 domain-containing protein [Ralstonia sp. 25C]|uniref:DUF4123 domain-containing protein n=1 Tax=Ralstonia sp. 25C TaxID=3447363 RepID=UPI003F74E249
MTVDSGGLVLAQNLEPAWEQWRERLLAQFEPSFDHEAPTHLYVLADTRGNPGVDTLLPQVPGLAWSSLWSGSVLESYVDISPYLIRIDRLALADPRDLQTRLVRRLWKEGHGLHMLTWIWSPLALEILSEHLRHYTQYETPDQRAYFLHFYDNRILERLRAVWTPEQAQAFISSCTELWYRDRDMNVVSWHNDAPPAHIADDGGQRLTAEQHAELLRLGHADKLAMQLRAMYGAALDKFSDAALYRRVSKQLERAARHRVTGDDALLSYVSKGVLVSATFDEHPVIAERLTRARQGSLSHSEALSQINRDVLREASRGQSPGGQHG